MSTDTEYVTTSRWNMIDALSKSMFDDIEMNLEKIEDLIMYGFSGYNNYTDDELLKEYREYLSEDPDADIVITFVSGGTGFKREDV
jgi:hypothetical protein